MRFYKIDMQGKQWLQRTTIPAWAAADEGRLIFDTASRVPFVGDNTDWQEIWTSGNMGVGSGLDADVLQGDPPGNASGNIPISNGVMCNNLIAQYLGASGQDAAFFRNAGNLNAGKVLNERLSGVTYDISITGTATSAKYS